MVYFTKFKWLPWMSRLEHEQEINKFIRQFNEQHRRQEASRKEFREIVALNKSYYEAVIVALETEIEELKNDRDSKTGISSSTLRLP